MPKVSPPLDLNARPESRRPNWLKGGGAPGRIPKSRRGAFVAVVGGVLVSARRGKTTFKTERTPSLEPGSVA